MKKVYKNNAIKKVLINTSLITTICIVGSSAFAENFKVPITTNQRYVENTVENIKENEESKVYCRVEGAALFVKSCYDSGIVSDFSINQLADRLIELEKYLGQESAKNTKKLAEILNMSDSIVLVLSYYNENPNINVSGTYEDIKKAILRISNSLQIIKSKVNFNKPSDKSVNSGLINNGDICYELSLMSKKDIKQFNIQENLTIAEAIAIASKVHASWFKGNGYFYSAEGAWYQKYVNYAVNNKIIELKQFNNLENPISKAEMAFIFSKALPEERLYKINKVYSLPDVGPATSYSDQIVQLYKAGILTGSDSIGTFHPNDTITRAEGSVIVDRLTKLHCRKAGLKFGNSNFNIFEKCSDVEQGYSLSNPKYGDHTYGVRTNEQYRFVLEKAEEYARKGSYKNEKTYFNIYDKWLNDEDLTPRENRALHTLPQEILDGGEDFVKHTYDMINSMNIPVHGGRGDDSAYLFLLKGEGDCDAAAYAVQAILDAQGYVTQVRHDNSHAWCEVYLDNGKGVADWYSTDGGIFRGTGGTGYLSQPNW